MRKALLTSAAIIAIISIQCVAAPAEEGVEIPLKNVLGLDMPGTEDIHSIDSGEDSLVAKVVKQISETRKFDHGFAVKGEGADALREFLRVRSDHEYWNRLPAGEPVTLVFFTEPIRENVVLQSIERRGTRIIPRFRFAPRDAAKPTPHLVLVPLGKLPLGAYSVTPERLPAEQQHLDGGFEEPPPQRFSEIAMGLGCSFHVVEGAGGAPPPEKLVEIPLEDVWAYEMPGTRDINEFGALNAEDSLVEKVILQIRATWKLRSGMVVQGEGREALENVYLTRTHKLHWNDIPANQPASLVFYTRGTSPKVHLDSVERQGQSFTIRYRVVPDRDSESFSTIAIIPIGPLPRGRFKVSIEQLPLDAQLKAQGYAEPPRALINDICTSFGFVVSK